MDSDGPCSAGSKNAVAETAATAKILLFDKNGNPKQSEHYLALFTLQTVLRRAPDARSGVEQLPTIRWRGDEYVYDSALVTAFLSEARAGNPIFDQILCFAAAVLLETTTGIPDACLRGYIMQRLAKDIPPPKSKKKGRKENSYRDMIIGARLIPPLLGKGFRPTRNEVTEVECACSIVSEALEYLGIRLSEKRIAEIWARLSPYVQAKPGAEQIVD